MRFRFVVAMLCTCAVAACASGNLGTGYVGLDGDGGTDDGSAPTTEAGEAGGGSDTSAEDTGSTGPTDSGSARFDSQPPLTDSGGGGVTDSGDGSATGPGPDAASDAPPDAPVDAPLDAPVDAPIDAGPPDCGAPGGSYAETCEPCSVSGTVLTCACKDDAQDADISTLNFCTCAQPPVISNQNGVLACSPP